MTTEHSQDRKCLIFREGGKQDSQENPRGTAEYQRTTQLTYGPGRESNQCHLGERRALYAQANLFRIKYMIDNLPDWMEFKNFSFFLKHTW